MLKPVKFTELFDGKTPERLKKPRNPKTHKPGEPYEFRISNDGHTGAMYSCIGSARKSLSGTLSTAGDGAASPTGTLPAAGTLAPATPSAHKDKRPRAAPPSASPQPLPDAEPNHASPNTEARMDAEHAEHADGVHANLDSAMADADDSLDGDLSDLIDDEEEQAEAHAKAEKEKERQKGGPFLSASPEEQGQGPDSVYVPTQEQTGAQHRPSWSLP